MISYWILFIVDVSIWSLCILKYKDGVLSLSYILMIEGKLVFLLGVVKITICFFFQGFWQFKKILNSRLKCINWRSIVIDRLRSMCSYAWYILMRSKFNFDFRVNHTFSSKEDIKVAKEQRERRKLKYKRKVGKI